MTSLLDVMTRRPRPLTTPARGDRVVLFPSLGHLSRDGRQWIVHVHGDVSTTGKMTLGRRVLLRLLQRTMRASDEELASSLFQERIARFVARDRAGRRIALELGQHVYRLPKKTRRNGHFQSAVRISVDELQEITAGTAEADGIVPLAVPGTAESPPAFGRAYLLPRTGLSVISDIDDTLKHSHVACKRTLLTNTFLRPFETIPGMAMLFRDWASQGAAFHYVSSSPWQLYEHLEQHLTAEGFPEGSFHLRAFRLRDHLLRRILMMRRSGKIGVIRSLMKMFPQRRFLLVGDSGEHDPEIYGTLARRYRRQIAGILIRRIDGPGNSKRRFGRALRQVDPALITLFRDAEELADLHLPSP
jgi:phosphatidate phosphatase APP1